MRAFSGALLFGIPSLYTLETWELGTFTEPAKLLLLLGTALVVSVALAYFAGFRLEPPTLFRSVDQAIDALAVAAVASVVTLAVLNRIAMEASNAMASNRRGAPNRPRRPKRRS